MAKLVKPSFITTMRVLGMLSVAAFGLAGYTVVKQSQAEAERQAERKAADASQVAACYDAVVRQPIFESALVTLEVLARNSVDANRTAIRVDPDSPLDAVRRRVLDRVEPRLPDLSLLVEQTQATSRTIPDCDELGRALDVDTARMRADALEAIAARAKAQQR